MIRVGEQLPDGLTRDVRSFDVVSYGEITPDPPKK